MWSRSETWRYVSSSSEVEWSSARWEWAEFGEGVRECDGEGVIVIVCIGVCGLESVSEENWLGVWFLTGFVVLWVWFGMIWVWFVRRE